MIILGMGSLLGRYGSSIFLCLVAEKSEETRILNFSFFVFYDFEILMLFYAWLSVHSGN